MAKKDPVAAPVLEAPATQKDIERWYVVAEQLAKAKEEEMTLRKKIAKTYFPDPVEGVNDVPMSDGWVMKMTYKIDRKIISEKFALLQDEFKTAKLPLKDLVRFKPDLAVGEYKKLTEEQRKLFDKAMEIKPGAPTLEITKPKRV